MTVMDKITEDISHFIGLFQISVEVKQLHHTYEEFSYHHPKPHLKELPFVPDVFEAPFEFIGFDPHVPYKSPLDTAPPWHPSLLWDDRQNPTHDVEDRGSFNHPDHPVPHHLAIPLRNSVPAPTIDPPGSVANYIVQAASLSDDDTFIAGGSNAVFDPEPIDRAGILKAAEDALDSAPISNVERPGSTGTLIEFVDAVAAELKELAAEVLIADASAAGEMETFVLQSETLEGSYVNGKLVEEAPDLNDHFTFDNVAEHREGENEDSGTAEYEQTLEEQEDGEPEPNAVVSPDGSITIDNSVDLIAGSNVVVNEAVVTSLWTGGTVTAVAGDHFEINAIIQTNVIQNSDTISGAISNWTSDGAADELFNFAAFERTDPLEESAAASPANGGFPSAWAIAEITGDLVITNWIEQYIFMSDNDIGILSSSGSTANIVAGDNTSINHTSVYELSLKYDLIIVGGSVYDASIIHQTNVLFDDDVISASAGFQTSGTGTASTGGNLLWNQALIYNVGGGERFGDLPDAYADTAERFADGERDIASGILKDPSFIGQAGLSVLYISGDLVNVQYIRQTAILGDSDQIALAMDAAHSGGDTEWTLTTGDNALISTASIIDLDSFGRTYVGGEQYSQETLYQAELVTHRPELLGLDPNALVNEAVLFLDDAMLDDSVHGDGSFAPPQYDPQYQHDGMQHLLG